MLRKELTLPLKDRWWTQSTTSGGWSGRNLWAWSSCWPNWEKRERWVGVV